MLHNVTKMTEIALNFHKSKKIFFSKEFYVDKEIGRAYTSFLRRDVAQSGSALEWGSRGRRFKSFHPDQKTETPRDLRFRRSLFCFWGSAFFSSSSDIPCCFFTGPEEPYDKDLSPAISRHGRCAKPSSPASRLYRRQKRPRSMSPWPFRILWDRRGQAAGRLPGDPFFRKSSPKGDPRVPFPQPSGKGVSWSSDLQPHPAF